MIVAVFVCFDHIHQKSCQIKGVGRSTDLVTDNSELVVCFGNIEHGTDKVFAVGSKYPGDTDDKIPVQNFGHCQFTIQLGSTIYV